MEGVTVLINQPNGEYDNIIKGSLPEYGDMSIITKDGVMESGRSAVMITFTVQGPDNKPHVAQCVTTMRLFLIAAKTLIAAYDDEGLRRSILNNPNRG